MEESFVPVRLIYEPTLATPKACESWVDQDYSFTPVFRFVRQKLPELIVSPVASHPVELLAFSSVSDVFKVFHSEEPERFFHDFFTEAMVVISHEPSLPTTERFEFTLSRTGAYGLEFTPHVSVTSFDAPDFRGFDDSVVRTNNEILNTQIYTKNFFVVILGNNSVFNNNFNLAHLSVDTDSNTFNFPVLAHIRLFFLFSFCVSHSVVFFTSCWLSRVATSPDAALWAARLSKRSVVLSINSGREKQVSNAGRMEEK